MTEFWRRLFLLAGLCAGVCLLHWASLGTYVTLERAAFAREQTNPHGFGLRTAAEDELAELPLAAYIERVTAGARLEVAGPAFTALFADVEAGLTGSAQPDLARRIRADERGWRLPLCLWYRADEPPLATLPLTTGPAVRWLRLGQGETARWLKLVRRPVSVASFSPFFGFSGYAPPWEMLYPYGRLAWWPAALGLVLYLVLPWPRRPAGGMSAGRVRVAVADVAWLLVFLPFFWLPFLLGGPLQSFSAWWGIAAVGWSLAGFGLLLLRYIAWFADFAVAPEPESLRVRSWGRTMLLRYADITAVRPAILTSPRWLTRLYAVLLPFARGGGGVRMAGMSMILSSAASRGWLFDLADGRTLALWWGDMGGRSVFKGQEVVAAALARAGFPAAGEPEVRRGFGGEFWPEPGRPSPGRRAWLLAAAAPLVLVAGFVLAAGVSAPMAPGPEPAPVAAGPDPTLPLLPAEAVDFETTLLPGTEARGVQVIAAGAGYGLLGTARLPEGWRAVVVAVDARGQVRWTRTLSGAYAAAGGSTAGAVLLAAPDGGFAVLSESLPANRLAGAADIARLDGQGAILWETSLDSRESLVTPVAMVRSDAYWTVLVEDRRNALGQGREGYFLISLDDAGEVVFESPVRLEREDAVLRAMLRDGRGFLLVGEIPGGAGRPASGLAMRLDLKGETVLTREVGGAEPQRFATVCPAPDGGAWLVGSAGPAGRTDALVASLDAHDTLRWQHRLGGADADAAVAAVPRGEGLAVLCRSRAADGSTYALVAGVSPAGGIDFLYAYGRGLGLEPEAFCAAPTGYTLTGTRVQGGPSWFAAGLSPQ